MAEKKTGIPLQQKVILGILAVAGLIMFYSKVYAPLQDKIKKSQELVEQKQAGLIDMKEKARQLDELEKEFKHLEVQLKLTETKLPKTKELPKFIRLITEAATRYGMNVDNLKVSAPAGSQYYTTHTYGLKLNSDYHTFGRFFAEIVQMDRIFNIKDVVFSPVTAGETEEELAVSFSVVAYTAK